MKVTVAYIPAGKNIQQQAALINVFIEFGLTSRL